MQQWTCFSINIFQVRPSEVEENMKILKKMFEIGIYETFFHHFSLNSDYCLEKNLKVLLLADFFYIFFS